MKTVREILAKDIDTSEVEVITIHLINKTGIKNIEEYQFSTDLEPDIPDFLLDAECIDYEIDYDADMEFVSLFIICK